MKYLAEKFRKIGVTVAKTISIVDSVLVDCLVTARLSDVLCAVMRKMRESAALSLRLFVPGLNRRTSSSAQLGESHGALGILLWLSIAPDLKHAGAWARSENLIAARWMKKSLGAAVSFPI